MKIYILGIGGTLMGGVAVLAKQLGHQVRGCDHKLYPPMSLQLEQSAIEYDLEYLPQHLDWEPDLVLVGNTITADSEIFLEIAKRKLAFSSAPEWLYDNVLKTRRVVAVTGTHGKTTTTTIIVKLLHSLNLDCGYLIAGSPSNLQNSASIGDGDLFVIEADEYDTACFDKVPKFMHYHPDILLINNLEFDHADIYADYQAIEAEFIKLINNLSSSATVLMSDANFALKKYCKHIKFYKDKASAWQVSAASPDASSFNLSYKDKQIGAAQWHLLGEHNLDNLRAALCVTDALDTNVEKNTAAIVSCLEGLQATARRLQDLGEHNSIRVLDDFAHHPTAIAKTIAAVKAKFPDRRLVACVGFASYSMRSGVHLQTLPQCFSLADKIILLDNANLQFALSDLLAELPNNTSIIEENSSAELLQLLQPDDVLLFMSNRDLVALRQAVLS